MPFPTVTPPASCLAPSPPRSRMATWIKAEMDPVKMQVRHRSKMMKNLWIGGQSTLLLWMPWLRYEAEMKFRVKSTVRNISFVFTEKMSFGETYLTRSSLESTQFSFNSVIFFSFCRNKILKSYSPRDLFLWKQSIFCPLWGQEMSVLFALERPWNNHDYKSTPIRHSKPWRKIWKLWQKKASDRNLESHLKIDLIIDLPDLSQLWPDRRAPRGHGLLFGLDEPDPRGLQEPLQVRDGPEQLAWHEEHLAVDVEFDDGRRLGPDQEEEEEGQVGVETEFDLLGRVHGELVVGLRGRGQIVFGEYFWLWC